MGKIEIIKVGLNVENEGTRLKLLNDVSLTVAEGTIHALLGPSGSGKSTLLYTLNRLREINEGKILLDSEDIRSLDVYELRRRVGLVMQKPIFFPGTVEQNILYGPKLWLKRKEKRSETGTELLSAKLFLEWVGLDPAWALRDPNTLSGGQQQRVALARTLANQPEVLLLDEPTSALDANSADLLEKLMMRLCDERQLTVLWVTHDLQQAKRVAQNVTLLYQGEIIEHGEAKKFFAQPETEVGKKYLAGRLGGEK